MWLPRSLLCLLAFAILPLVSAQSSNSTQPSSATSGGSSAPAASAQITVITSVSTSVGIGASRVETTAISTFLITSTIQPTSASTEPSPTSSPASSTTTANLPTGTASLVTDQAPSPGATGGSYGPDDGYINAAHTLTRNVLLLGSGVVVGGLLAL